MSFKSVRRRGRARCTASTLRAQNAGRSLLTRTARLLKCVAVRHQAVVVVANSVVVDGAATLPALGRAWLVRTRRAAPRRAVASSLSLRSAWPTRACCCAPTPTPTPTSALAALKRRANCGRFAPRWLAPQSSLRCSLAFSLNGRQLRGFSASVEGASRCAAIAGDGLVDVFVDDAADAAAR